MSRRVSERHACGVVGQPRSTQRLVPPVAIDDELAYGRGCVTSPNVVPLEMATSGHRGGQGWLAGQPQTCRGLPITNPQIRPVRPPPTSRQR